MATYAPNSLDKLAKSGQPNTVFNLLISHQQGMFDLSGAHIPNVEQNSLNLCLYIAEDAISYPCPSLDRFGITYDCIPQTGDTSSNPSASPFI